MIICTHQVCHIGRFELHKLDAGAELLLIEEHLGQQQRQQEQQQREHGRGQPQQWGEQWRCWEGGGGEDELAAEVSITITTIIVAMINIIIITICKGHPHSHLEVWHYNFIIHLLPHLRFASSSPASWLTISTQIIINVNQKLLGNNKSCKSAVRARRKHNKSPHFLSRSHEIHAFVSPLFTFSFIFSSLAAMYWWLDDT